MLSSEPNKMTGPVKNQALQSGQFPIYAYM